MIRDMSDNSYVMQPKLALYAERAMLNRSTTITITCKSYM